VVAEGRLGGGKGDDRLPGDDVSSRPVATSPPARRSRPAATADPADVLGQGAAEEAEFIGERAPDVGLPTAPVLAADRLFPDQAEHRVRLAA
jgi:hypothetical protein